MRVLWRPLLFLTILATFAIAGLLLSRQTWLLADNSPIRNLIEALSWMAAIATLVGAAGSGAWRWFHKSKNLELSSAATTRNMLTGRALFLIDGNLPKVSEVGMLDMRVKPAMDTETDADLPPFVERDRDEDIEWAIAQNGMVLLHGRAASGKTRAAAEAIRHLCPNHKLLIPCDGITLRELISEGLDLQNTIVWLDDLERFLGPGGLNTGLLHHISHRGLSTTIVSTMRDDVLTNYDNAFIAGDSDENTAPHGSVELIQHLRGRRRIRIERQLSEHEHLKASQISDRRIEDALKAEEGFAEYLVAGRAMLGKWSTGDGALFQVGQAIISAAVDCRRAGYHKPIPASILKSLHTHYIDPIWSRRQDLPTVDEGIEWAGKLVLGANSCLQHHPSNTYLASDYLTDCANHSGSPLSQSPVRIDTWNTVLAISSSSEALYIGLAAQQSYYNEIANKAFRKAATVGDTHAMNHLGILSIEKGNKDQAKEWWHKAAQDGDVGSMVNLGDLLREGGETTQAEVWYRKAADAGDPRGLYCLASMHFERGEMTQAEAWYRKSAETSYSPAMVKLGYMLYEGGDIKGAEAWLRIAAEVNYIPALYYLGLMYAEIGETTEAEICYRRAAESSDEFVMYKAANNLGAVLEERGEATQAETWYRTAAESTDKKAMLNGAHNLGDLLEERGEATQAETWYRTAAEGGHTLAMLYLGKLLHVRGESTEAKTWLRRAAESNDQFVMYKAANNLGALLDERGESIQAETWYRKAAESTDQVAMLHGAHNLGILFYERGETTQAETWYRTAAEGGYPLAMLELGKLLHVRGESTEAETWLRKAAQSSTP